MRLHRFLPVVLTFAAAVCAPALQAQQQQHTMNNTELVKLVQAGVPESAILASIRSCTPAFDLSSDGLIALHNAGVTQAELETAIAASNAAHPNRAAAVGPAATSTAASASLSSVALLVNGAPRQLALEKVQLAQTKQKPTSLTSLSGDTMLSQAMQTGVNATAWEAASHVGSPLGYMAVGSSGGLLAGAMRRHQSAVTYVWGIPGATSANVTPTTTPAFVVNVAGVPGVNPDDYEPAIVKLTPSGNAVRLLGPRRAKRMQTRARLRTGRCTPTSSTTAARLRSSFWAKGSSGFRHRRRCFRVSTMWRCGLCRSRSSFPTRTSCEPRAMA